MVITMISNDKTNKQSIIRTTFADYFMSTVCCLLFVVVVACSFIEQTNSDKNIIYWTDNQQATQATEPTNEQTCPQDKQTPKHERNKDLVKEQG